ncbi:hypothetical protein PsYK624_169460 [Phanerochaete sordida]|uniref:F-box domain-containing protein n=1 Tax=Phanerochaete sordida TaxID=48140 RepID=A0A9P3GU44_9APHY|nr:hypothetical protein PsYK624_169460 [Phanerochaete sordida]
MNGIGASLPQEGVGGIGAPTAPPLTSGMDSREAVRGVATLPQELIDHIIDFLHTSKAILKHCTLVARAWVPPSRFHLFARVQLWEGRFSDFLAFVTTCAEGPQYIRDLTFNGNSPQQDMGSRCAVSPAYLQRMLVHLPRLECLMLYMTGLFDDDASVFESMPFLSPPSQAPIRLKSLSMYYYGTPTDRVIDFALVLAVFTSVGKLHLRHGRFWANHPPTDVPQELADTPRNVFASLPAVQTLVIDDNASRTNLLLGAAVRTAGFGGLRAVEIQSRQMWDHAALGALLRAVGPRLEHLSLQLSGLCEPDDTEAFVAQAGLASCTALITLALLIDASVFHRRALSWATVSMLVAAVPRGAPVRTVRLLVGLHTLENEVFHPWNPMDEVLERFDHLDTVAFEQKQYEVYTEEGKERVRGAFPRVARKANIEFVVGE